jgi:hypothetical protein
LPSCSIAVPIRTEPFLCQSMTFNAIALHGPSMLRRLRSSPWIAVPFQR